MNVGTIVEAPVMRVRLGRGKLLGEVEEYFVSMLAPGDTFLFAGRLLALRGHPQQRGDRQPGQDRARPQGAGLCRRQAAAHHPSGRPRAPPAGRAIDAGTACRTQVGEWLAAQARRSKLPAPDELLVETFPHEHRHYMVAYSFEGWNAHQSLGMLITRRMESAGLRPLGFVSNDYALAVYGLDPITDPAALFSADILEDEFVEWVQGSSLLKRAFREVAVIGGLVERHHPGKRKSGRQVSFSTDLIYDVLRRYEPDHLLLRAAWADARARMTDVGRLADLLVAVEGRIRHVAPRPDLTLRGLDHRRHRQGVRFPARSSTNCWTRRWRNWSRRPWRTSFRCPCSCSCSESVRLAPSGAVPVAAVTLRPQRNARAAAHRSG